MVKIKGVLFRADCNSLKAPSQCCCNVSFFVSFISYDINPLKDLNKFFEFRYPVQLCTFSFENASKKKVVVLTIFPYKNFHSIHLLLHLSITLELSPGYPAPHSHPQHKHTPLFLSLSLCRIEMTNQ